LPLQAREVSIFFSDAGLVVAAPLPNGSYRVVATLVNAPERPGIDAARLIGSQAVGRREGRRDRHPRHLWRQGRFRSGGALWVSSPALQEFISARAPTGEQQATLRRVRRVGPSTGRVYLKRGFRAWRALQGGLSDPLRPLWMGRSQERDAFERPLFYSESLSFS
jgi:hypothetical protein